MADLEPAVWRLNVYLCCRDADAALAFYERAFGAVQTERWLDDDGRVHHAEMDLHGVQLMLADEFPEIDVRSPQALGGSPVTMLVHVPEVDTVFATAVTAGATAVREPADQPYGVRLGKLIDPFGHVWMLATELG